MSKKYLFLISVSLFFLFSCEKETIEIVVDNSTISSKETIEIVVDNSTISSPTARNYFDTSLNLLQSRKLWIDIYQVYRNNNLDPWAYAINTFTVADFDQDGYEDIIVAPSAWLGSSTKIELQFFKNLQDNVTFKLSSFPIEGDIKGTASARTVALGDFNKDGKPDVVFAESGEDFEPFLGTYSSILISTQTGYTIKPITEDSLFQHSIASGDIDNDGDLDIVFGTVMNTYQPEGSSVYYHDREGYVYLNDGVGNFTRDLSWTEEFNAVQEGVGALADINKDGYLDYIEGRVEAEGPTRIYWGNGVNFSDNRSTAVELLEQNWKSVTGISVKDINQDGVSDLIISRSDMYWNYNYIQIVDGSTFRDVTLLYIQDNTLAEDTSFFYETTISDIDNNGKLDIYVVDKGHQEKGTVRWEQEGPVFIKK